MLRDYCVLRYTYRSCGLNRDDKATAKSDACFFDPNLGEVWFEKKADFFEFFPSYHQFYYQRNTTQTGDFWCVMPCAPIIK